MYLCHKGSIMWKSYRRHAVITLHWRHNEHHGVSNHQPHGCLLNRLFGRRSKKTSKFSVTGLCAGNSPGPVNSPHKGPVTREMFPFDDVIMMTHLSVTVHVPCGLLEGVYISPNLICHDCLTWYDRPNGIGRQIKAELPSCHASGE